MTLERASGSIAARGWLKEFFRRDARGITGNLDKLCRECAVDIFGKDKVDHQEKGYWSSWWTGEIQGNWLKGLFDLAFVAGDKRLIGRARAIVENILANQSPDGYIGIYREDCRYVVTKRFGELWTQSRVMNALLCYYEYTREERVLTALERMADNIVANVKRSVYAIPDEDGSKGHSLMIVEGLYALYNMTKKPAYRDFCEWLYADYCAHASEFMQDDLRLCNLFDPDVPFVGHGPHTCEMLRIPLLLYRMTQKEDYLLAFRCALKKLGKNLSLSGSCKSDEFIGTYQSTLVMEDASHAEVFGGSVPLPTAAYEYCSTTELALDYITAEEILGDVTFADKLEWLVYNAGLASKHPSGKMIQYLGADNMYDASHVINPRYDYSPTHDDAAICCAPNSCRLMPMFAERAFLTDGRALIANLYLPMRFSSRADGMRAEIDVQTEYPYRYDVTFAVRAATQPFAFALRIPAYARTISVRKNGVSCAYDVTEGVAFLRERVGAGDRVEVAFSPEIRMLRAVDGSYALSYGTLLFSKEIAADCRRYRKYDGAKGFYDCDYLPKPHEDWNYTLLAKDPVNCRLAKVELRDGKAYPADRPSIVLAVQALDRSAYPVKLELVPIGATTLRRTTFPIYIDREGVYR